MYTPNLITQTLVKEKIRECYKKLEDTTGCRIPRVSIKYDLKGRVTGQARGRDCVIRLNPEALFKHEEYILNQTIPHEVAHIAAWYIYKVGGHGRHWKLLMNILGVQANRCHNLELTKARRTRRYPYECKCQTHWLSSTRHKRAMGFTNYRCKKCHTVVSYTGKPSELR